MTQCQCYLPILVSPTLDKKVDEIFDTSRQKVDELMRRRLKMNHRRQFVDPDENSLPKKLPPLNEKLGDGS